MKPTHISAGADADLVAFYDHYLEVADFRIAEEFSQRTQDALTHIERFPRTGSTRYASFTPSSLIETDEEGEMMLLRSWTYKQFPLIIFYIERKSCISIVRVLHQAADLPQHLSNPTS